MGKLSPENRKIAFVQFPSLNRVVEIKKSTVVKVGIYPMHNFTLFGGSLKKIIINQGCPKRSYQESHKKVENCIEKYRFREMRIT